MRYIHFNGLWEESDIDVFTWGRAGGVADSRITIRAAVFVDYASGIAAFCNGTDLYQYVAGMWGNHGAHEGRCHCGSGEFGAELAVDLRLFGFSQAWGGRRCYGHSDFQVCTGSNCDGLDTQA